MTIYYLCSYHHHHHYYIIIIIVIVVVVVVVVIIININDKTTPCISMQYYKAKDERARTEVEIKKFGLRMTIKHPAGSW